MAWSNNLFYIVLNGLLDYIFRAMNIGLYAFHRVTFSSRYLFQCSGMYNIIR